MKIIITIYHNNGGTSSQITTGFLVLTSHTHACIVSCSQTAILSFYTDPS